MPINYDLVAVESEGAIHGKAWFAKKFIPKGTIIWQMDFTKIDPKRIVKRTTMESWSLEEQERFNHYAWMLDENTYIGYPPNFERKNQVESVDDDDMNHSCDGNCGFFQGTADKVVTIRDVEKGMELTYDYRLSECNENWKGFKCGCGSPKCRGVVNGSDWKTLLNDRELIQFATPAIQKLLSKLK